MAGACRGPCPTSTQVCASCILSTLFKCCIADYSLHTFGVEHLFRRGEDGEDGENGENGEDREDGEEGEEADEERKVREDAAVARISAMLVRMRRAVDERVIDH